MIATVLAHSVCSLSLRSSCVQFPLSPPSPSSPAAMLDWLFPESAEMGLGALVFMLAVYGYILCRARSERQQKKHSWKEGWK